MTLPTHSRERDALDQIVIELRRLEPLERWRVLTRLRADLDAPSDDDTMQRLADRSRPL